MKPISSQPAAPLFPLFADLRGKPVLVVGGGTVAKRKIQALLPTGAQVRVGAPSLEESVAQWAAAGQIIHLAGEFTENWLNGVWLVIAATDDDQVNQTIAAAAQTRRLFVNVVDDADKSTFQVPARVERGPLQIAISSHGHAPMLARQLREQLERQIDPSLGELAQLFADQRQHIRQRFPDLSARRRFFQQVLDSSIPALFRQQQADLALAQFNDMLAAGNAKSHLGSVVLVGAGPGDPGLLTLRALRALNEADVIIHDRLVSPQVLDMARRDAHFIEVAKEAGNHHTTQEGIHQLLLEHALSGARVVRLKGGDPFVFGRGGEELEFLRAHEIRYEVIPGITAATACAAYSGIPLTHRDHAQSVRLVTAHCKNSLDNLDWRALATDRQTLAVYMGVLGLDALRERLIAHGRNPDTPFALIENGSRPQQRVVLGTLERLPEIAVEQSVKSPALLILGEVAGLASRLHWFGAAPQQSTVIQVKTKATAVA